jgi:hypothetical protein
MHVMQTKLACRTGYKAALHAAWRISCKLPAGDGIVFALLKRSENQQAK